ncbi:sigma-70 family RNA polymerase sigma factor [Pontiellaceae bacterium B12219]|nr:sigma-70 family RNA polymerase sigma factor [Pontiellaceae bacterium B12219]
MERTDQELVKASLEGNRSAFALLVSRHQDSVFGLAVGMTRNREDAADMAQEAFIKAYNKLEQYNPEYAFRSWILRICANQTKNLFRKRTRRRDAEEKSLNAQAVLASSTEPDFQPLEEALAQLAPKPKERAMEMENSSRKNPVRPVQKMAIKNRIRLKRAIRKKSSRKNRTAPALNRCSI